MANNVFVFIVQDHEWRLTNGSLGFSLFYKDSLTPRLARQCQTGQINSVNFIYMDQSNQFPVQQL